MAVETVEVKLARIEEQLKTLIDKFEHLEDTVNRFATKDELDKAENRIENTIKGFVSKDEFTPVKNIVYGLVGTILLGFIGVMINFFMGG